MRKLPGRPVSPFPPSRGRSPIPNYPVNAATRQHIAEVARALGYRPNLATRSLRTDQTNAIGIIADDILSPFVPPIIRGIQDYLRQQDYLGPIVSFGWAQRSRKMRSMPAPSPLDGLLS